MSAEPDRSQTFQMSASDGIGLVLVLGGLEHGEQTIEALRAGRRIAIRLRVGLNQRSRQQCNRGNQPNEISWMQIGGHQAPFASSAYPAIIGGRWTAGQASPKLDAGSAL